jgi:hypothetical protein
MDILAHAPGRRYEPEAFVSGSPRLPRMSKEDVRKEVERVVRFLGRQTFGVLKRTIQDELAIQPERISRILTEGRKSGRIDVRRSSPTAIPSYFALPSPSVLPPLPVERIVREVRWRAQRTADSFLVLADTRDPSGATLARMAFGENALAHGPELMDTIVDDEIAELATALGVPEIAYGHAGRCVVSVPGWIVVADASLAGRAKLRIVAKKRAS